MKKVLCVLAAGALAGALLAGCGASAVDAGQDAAQTQYYPYNGVTSRNLGNPDDYNYAGPLDYSDLNNLNLLSRVKQYNQLECMVRRFDTIHYTTQWSVAAPEMVASIVYTTLNTDLTLHKDANGYWQSNNLTVALRPNYERDDAGNIVSVNWYEKYLWKDYLRQTDDRYVLDISVRESKDGNEATLEYGGTPFDWNYPLDWVRILHPYYEDDTASVFNVALNRDIGNGSIATWVDQGIVTVENSYMDGDMAVIQICYTPGNPDYRLDETYYVDTTNDVIRHFVQSQTQVSTNTLIYKYETSQEVNTDFDEKTDEINAAIHAKDGELQQTSFIIDGKKMQILFSLDVNYGVATESDYGDGYRSLRKLGTITEQDGVLQ